MTRWARAGNALKHQKMPEDATPWEKFWKNGKSDDKSESNLNKVKSGRIEKKKQKNTFSFNKPKKLLKNSNFLSDIKVIKNAPKFKITHDDESNSDSESDHVKRNNMLIGKNVKNIKKEAKFQELGIMKLDNSQNSSHSNSAKANDEMKMNLSLVAQNRDVAEHDKVLSKSQLKRVKKEAKLQDLEFAKLDNFENCSDSSNSEDNEETKTNTSVATKSMDVAEHDKALTKNQLKRAKKTVKFQKLGIAKLDNSQKGNDSNNTEKTKINTSVATENANVAEYDKVLSKSQLKKAKKKQKLQALKIPKWNNSQDSVSHNSQANKEMETNNSLDIEKTDVVEHKVLSKGQLKRAKKKAKLQALGIPKRNNPQNRSGSNDADKNGETKNGNLAKEKDFQGKKKLFMQRLEKKRLEKGITLLPAKVERKLYLIKKKLREKGLASATIKEVARKERRKEELKFRKTFNTKHCYNCRQIGHVLSECPLPQAGSSQKTGICFKCGSDEHTSQKCQKKIEGYPLATCFVCKQQGHISRDCPKNKHGVYPKGGKCNICGNVNHLKKDCPTLKKNDDEQAMITLHTINEGKSVDAEIVNEPELARKKGKKMKIVTF